MSLTWTKSEFDSWWDHRLFLDNLFQGWQNSLNLISIPSDFARLYPESKFEKSEQGREPGGYKLSL